MNNDDFAFLSLIEALTRKSEEYRRLNKEDVKLIPNEDLKEAVMDWMFEKVDADEFIIISKLPTPCQDVYSTVTIMNEVLNGGFNQLFFNSTVEFIEMAHKGFVSIGLPKLSKLLNQACQVYLDNKEILEKYDDGTIESFSDSYEENLFDDLDMLFSKEEENFEKLIIEYIRKNETYFGD
ncbi:MAG TPA: DMP19 family protein [Acholeplasmataceae bacterium]|nr:DMP19 family protein [Acholeplasmataceae bacterium]